MPRVAGALVIAMVAARLAVAAPPDRVLLADPDPELLHAVQSSLAPWKLAIVVEADVPADDRSASARAAAEDARFVVWREGDQLVVFDRARGASERRPARAGRFDAIDAASAALTVKTMMRLPPPPPEDAPEIVTTPRPAPPPPAEAAHAEIRIEVGAAARISPTGGESTGARVPLAVMVRPRSTWGWRVGVRGDLGTSTAIDSAGFSGTWAHWALLAATSWTFERGPWELEPWVGAGVARAELEGTQMAAARSEAATLFTVRGGAYLRRRFSAVSAGIALELVSTPTAPTYTRPNPGMGMGTPTVFEASKFSLVAGFAIAVDLGR